MTEIALATVVVFVVLVWFGVWFFPTLFQLLDDRRARRDP